MLNGNALSTGNASETSHGRVAAWQRGVVARPTFAENLRSQMKTYGLTQTALGKRVRVKTSTVNRWLGGRIPGGQDLLAVARVLEIGPYDLLGSSFKEPLPEQAEPKRGRPKADRSVDAAAQSFLDKKPEAAPGPAPVSGRASSTARLKS